MTKRKPAKKVVQEPAAVVDMSASDRAALIAAYQAGIISAWKHDGERGYRLTVPGRVDDCVDPAKLTSYLEKLRGVA
jgi:hypothetical protein